MAATHSEESKRDAVRIPQASGLTRLSVKMHKNFANRNAETKITSVMPACHKTFGMGAIRHTSWRYELMERSTPEGREYSVPLVGSDVRGYSNRAGPARNVGGGAAVASPPPIAAPPCKGWKSP